MFHHPIKTLKITWEITTLNRKKRLMTFAIFKEFFFLRDISAWLKVPFSDFKILSFFPNMQWAGEDFSCHIQTNSSWQKKLYCLPRSCHVADLCLLFLHVSWFILGFFLVSSFDILPADFGYLKTWNSRIVYILNWKLFCRTCDDNDFSAAQAPLMQILLSQ